MDSATITSQLTSLSDRLLGFAFSLTGNRDDAQDLLQDTMLKVLDNTEKYAADQNFKCWVFTIMRNIFINNYHRAARTASIIDGIDEKYHLDVVAEHGYANPEGCYATAEINNTINSFPELYRTPLSMLLNGYRYDEIASEINVPVGTVKSRIFVARQQLQQRLADYR